MLPASSDGRVRKAVGVCALFEGMFGIPIDHGGVDSQGTNIIGDRDIFDAMLLGYPAEFCKGPVAWV